jgi:amino acid transporter
MMIAAALVAGLAFIALLAIALIAGLAFIALLAIALVAGLTFIAFLAGSTGSDALFQLFYDQVQLLFHTLPFCCLCFTGFLDSDQRTGQYHSVHHPRQPLVPGLTSGPEGRRGGEETLRRAFLRRPD